MAEGKAEDRAGDKDKVALVLRLRRLRRRLMYQGIRALVRLLGFDGSRRLGLLLGELQFRLDWRQRRRCQRDMAAVLGRGDDDPRNAAQLREAYRVNTAALLEVLSMYHHRLDDATLQAHCRIDGLDRLDAALAAGRGVVLLGVHAGNALLMAAQLAVSGRPVSVVYRQSRMVTQGLFEQGLALYGIDGILANEGLKAYARMLGAVRQNRILLVMIDQGVKHAQDGIVMRFLGKDMPMPAGPAQLARHSKAPVLPVATVAAAPVWQFSIEAPLQPVAGSTLETDLAALLHASECQVLDHPQLWSWHHRRWRRFPLAPPAH